MFIKDGIQTRNPWYNKKVGIGRIKLSFQIKSTIYNRKATDHD